ncbi:molybdenum cofactor guanylyltransferase [Williamsia sp. CHRR-6]|uniref:molybdenum cofactor guanylyltransferase n=1 Tax=Williamsia sp. CHRR-6 TaxID=2835871 RepID=UPI001BDAE388|nr:molybdenum cofactor guanylyltransferase [Williamsia sp. CHRR-6]MBT0568313.1 molybdenum cofactor guanylyltransferase [Williamsia sp. CHRR-6]
MTDVAGVVLAGGASRRMGSDKAGLDWNGEPMLARIVGQLSGRCQPIAVVAAASSPAYRTLKGTGGPEAHWVTDEQAGAGPLGALAAGLADAAAAGHEIAFVCATDMPLISAMIVDELLVGLRAGDDAAIAVDTHRVHPFAGVYRTSCARRIRDLAATGERRMLAAVDSLTTNRVAISTPEWLTNVNAPEDLHRLRTAAAGR